MTDRFELDSYLDILESIDKQIDDTTERVEEFVDHHPHARLIMSMPGVSYYSALMICAEIGDITRFPDKKKLVCFAGLNPSVYQSGNKCRTGRIAKQGDRNLRWILLQCANVAVMHDKYLAKFYHHLKEKKNHNIAIVAVARKMLELMYTMMKYNIPYHALQMHKKPSVFWHAEKLRFSCNVKKAS